MMHADEIACCFRPGSPWPNQPVHAINMACIAVKSCPRTTHVALQLLHSHRTARLDTRVSYAGR